MRPFPNVQGGRWQISTSGGGRPLWARSGKELFYFTGRGASIMAVPVQTGAAFSSENSKKLFDWPSFAVPGNGRNYDVSGDGQRFLMIKESAGSDSSSTPAAPSIVVVINWTEELKARVLTK